MSTSATPKTQPRAYFLSHRAGRDVDLQSVIEEALREIGIDAISLADVLEPGESVAAAVNNAIQKADLVVADLSKMSPWVLYEIGYAHALRKPTVLLMNREAAGSEMPFDLAGQLYIIYDNSDPRGGVGFREQLKRLANHELRRS